MLLRAVSGRQHPSFHSAAGSSPARLTEQLDIPQKIKTKKGNNPNAEMLNKSERNGKKNPVAETVHGVVRLSPFYFCKRKIIARMPADILPSETRNQTHSVVCQPEFSENQIVKKRKPVRF